MKKILTLSMIFSFCLLFFVQAENATSAACDSHGGANCSIGASTSGNVICNDGWESLTKFFQASECQTSCEYPISSGCRTESDYGSLAEQQFSSGRQYTEQSIGLLSTCRSQIISYQARLNVYNSCLFSRSTVTPVCPPNSSLTGSKCSCSTGYRFNTTNDGCISLDSLCSKQDPNSFYNPDTDKCQCYSSYILKDGKCVNRKTTNQCQNLLGHNGDVDLATDNCYCRNDLVLVGSQCVNHDKVCTSYCNNASAYWNLQTQQCNMSDGTPCGESVYIQAPIVVPVSSSVNVLSPKINSTINRIIIPQQPPKKLQVVNEFNYNNVKILSSTYKATSTNDQYLEIGTSTQPITNIQKVDKGFISIISNWFKGMFTKIFTIRPIYNGKRTRTQINF